MEYVSRSVDLESVINRGKLGDPEAHFAAHRDKVIVIGEIQRAPDIFQIWRGEIGTRRHQNDKVGKSLLTGFASIVLLRQSSNSLPERISFAELTPTMSA